MTRIVSLVSDRLDACVKVFMQITLSAIVLLVLLDVALRNLLGTSLFWIEEVTVTYLGTWLFFVGSSHVLKAGLMIKVEFLVTRLSRGYARVALILTEVCILLFLGVIIVYGLRLSRMALTQPSPALELPMGLAYAGVVVGAVLMFLQSSAGLLVALYRREGG